MKSVPTNTLPLPTPPESVSDADTDEHDEEPSSPPPPKPTSVWLPVPNGDGTPSEKPRLHASRPPDLQLFNSPTDTSPSSYYLSPYSPVSPHPVLPPTPLNPVGLTYAYSPSRRWHKFLRSEPFWLLLYFLFNLGLTLYNKLVLVRFPFPYTLTALHAFSGTIGSYIAMEAGYFTPARLTARESFILTMFSLLYTINIAVSNLSLQLVTVPFHQVVRATTPLFIIALSYVFMSTVRSTAILLSLVPVMVGVGFATYGDYYFTAWGLVLTLIGTVLAALKTIVTNVLQTGSMHTSRTRRSRFARLIPVRLLPARPLKLHPLDLLLRMSPLAFIQCVLYAHVSGELEGVRAFGAQHMNRQKAAALAVNGAMAFGLNVVSFTANSKVGPLSITVAANVKQVLTILLAVSIFDLSISPMNGLGIALTILGGAWYAAVEYREKKRKRELLSLTSPVSTAR